MKEQIKFKEFNIDKNIIASNIYEGQTRQIDNIWIEISEELNSELTIFLDNYINFQWLKWKKTFFRIDAYFDKNRLYILDMNASFVDWWGNALNFARAIWEKVDNLLINNFPKKIKLQKEEYRPEFELCIRELNILFFNNQINGYEYPDFKEVSEINTKDEETYIYWDTNLVWKNILPYNWMAIDNKVNLANFSKCWKWDLVKVPDFILPTELNYSKLPNEVVLKIAWKEDIRPDWRNKVFIWKPKKWWKMWEEWRLVAQEKINPTKNYRWENTQAIILSVWSNALVWYVQNSTRDIINDNSIQSPLVLN